MAGKLKRLSATTQETLKQLACLGNVADVSTLALVHGETEETMHAALREAVHAGLVVHQDNAYKFLHDRIQQAAYSLIPEERRAQVHLRIGRVLLASMTAEELAEHLFEVANQLDRGVALLIDRDEKRRWPRSTCGGEGRRRRPLIMRISCGSMALLDKDWGSQHD